MLDRFNKHLLVIINRYLYRGSPYKFIPLLPLIHLTLQMTHKT